VAVSRGHDRERRIRDQLTDEGWIVIRAAGSLGPVDLVALRSGFRPRIIEVKSTHRGPFHSFGPQERREMRNIAIDAGADAELCWWPARKDPEFIPSSQWPEQQRNAA
jgi:Holliday junction resolvase